MGDAGVMGIEDWFLKAGGMMGTCDGPVVTPLSGA